MAGKGTGFAFHPTGDQFVALGDSRKNPVYDEGRLVPIGEFPLHPASAVLNYGVSCFEGLKAYRQPDGSVRLFRPDRNAARLTLSAGALNLPPVPEPTFVRGCVEVVRSCLASVPAHGEGTLYLRPVLFGTEPLLGVSAGHTTRLSIFASPVGGYFDGHADGGEKGLRLLVQEGARVPPGGLGYAKCSANYASTLLARRKAKDAGYDDALYLDAHTHALIEETASSNVMAVLRDGRLVTPALSGAILEGVTRNSVLAIAAEDLKLKVEERPLPLQEVLDSADEFFVCGTAVVIGPVSTLHVMGRDHRLPKVPGPITRELRKRLLDIQEGRTPDRRGWLLPVEPR